MLVIPAIDLKDGACVRLSQGKMDQATVYSDDPVEMARRWEAEGAQRLHIVDLDGAIAGKPVNLKLVEKIRAAVNLDIEIGGGIRSMETVKQYCDAGVTYIILGTAAITRPDFLAAACDTYPGRIIVGIDACNGMVAVRGWTETTSVTAIEVARRIDSTRVAAIIFTDISRDGMLTGPNITSTAALAQAGTIPIIASGGISSIEDVLKLVPLEPQGVIGVIIGRALYTGTIDLRQCIAGVAGLASPVHHRRH